VESGNLMNNTKWTGDRTVDARPAETPRAANLARLAERTAELSWLTEFPRRSSDHRQKGPSPLNEEHVAEYVEWKKVAHQHLACEYPRFDEHDRDDVIQDTITRIITGPLRFTLFCQEILSTMRFYLWTVLRWAAIDLIRGEARSRGWALATELELADPNSATAVEQVDRKDYIEVMLRRIQAVLPELREFDRRVWDAVNMSPGESWQSLAKKVGLPDTAWGRVRSAINRVVDALARHNFNVAIYRRQSTDTNTLFVKAWNEEEETALEFGGTDAPEQEIGAVSEECWPDD
jgi:DNA-directed RNA polymerase specialized sigma24 family protein